MTPFTNGSAADTESPQIPPHAADHLSYEELTRRYTDLLAQHQRLETDANAFVKKNIELEQMVKERQPQHKPRRGHITDHIAAYIGRYSDAMPEIAKLVGETKHLPTLTEISRRFDTTFRVKMEEEALRELVLEPLAWHDLLSEKYGDAHEDQHERYLSRLAELETYRPLIAAAERTASELGPNSPAAKSLKITKDHCAELVRQNEIYEGNRERWIERASSLLDEAQTSVREEDARREMLSSLVRRHAAVIPCHVQLGEHGEEYLMRITVPGGEEQANAVFGDHVTAIGAKMAQTDESTTVYERIAPKDMVLASHKSFTERLQAIAVRSGLGLDMIVHEHLPEHIPAEAERAGKRGPNGSRFTYEDILSTYAGFRDQMGETPWSRSAAEGYIAGKGIERASHSVFRDIQQMIEHGKVVAEGERRNTKYRFTKE